MVFGKKHRRNDGFSDSSLGSRITAPFRNIGRAFGRMLHGDQSIGSERSTFGTILAILLLPFQLLWSFVVFMVLTWTTSRNGRAFFFGIPAVLTALAFLGVLWLVGYYGEPRVLAQSLARYNYHTENDKDRPELAEMFAEKLVDINPEEPTFSYQLATSYEASGKIDSAVDLMRSLAIEGDEGLPIAHTWLAEYYRRSRSLDLTPEERLELAKKHLEFALKTNPDDVLANCGLAATYREQGNLEKAVEHYEIAFNQPLQHMAQLLSIPQIIEIRKEMGQESRANAMAKNAIAKLTPYAMKNPDILQLWVTLVQCCTLTGDYDQAEKFIEDGYQLTQDKEIKKNILRLASEILVKKAEDNADANDPEQFKERLWALTQAIFTDFRNARAYDQLMFFVANDELTDEQHIWLDDAVVGCPSPGVMHIVLGMQKIRKNNYVEGQKHWRIGHQQFQFAEYAINNLIEMSSRHNPEAGQQKMEWIEIAIEMFQEQPVLLMTRGSFYLADKKYKEAIADLEKVVEKMPNMILVHERLIDCYEAIGDTENANIHKDTLEVLMESLSRQQKAMIRVGNEIGKKKEEDAEKDGDPKEQK